MQYITVEDIEFAVYELDGCLYADCTDGSYQFMSAPTDGETIKYKSTNTLKFINDYHKLVFKHDDGVVIMMHPVAIECQAIYNKLFGLFAKEERLNSATKTLKSLNENLEKMRNKAYDAAEQQAQEMVMFIEKLEEVRKREAKSEAEPHTEAKSEAEPRTEAKSEAETQ
jgi:hypothetical protein